MRRASDRLERDGPAMRRRAGRKFFARGVRAEQNGAVMSSCRVAQTVIQAPLSWASA